MWDDLVTLGILGLFIAIVITPVIALILRLFIKTPFIKGWMRSTIILEALLIFVVGTVLVITHFEEESYLKKMDERIEEMDDKEKEGNSTEKVLMEIYTTGGSGNKYGRGNLGTVSYVIKNYNEAHFIGKATIYLLLNGEVIDETEVDLDLSPKEALSDYVDASTLNITRKTRRHIEFEYSVQGDFK